MRLQSSIALAFTGCVLLGVACDNDTQTNPTPTMAAGSITVSPPGVGLVDVTAFAFTAQGFSSSDGGALTDVWDFHDGTKTTGGASVTHTFASTGTFDIWVTATSLTESLINRLKASISQYPQTSTGM